MRLSKLTAQQMRCCFYSPVISPVSGCLLIKVLIFNVSNANSLWQEREQDGGKKGRK